MDVYCDGNECSKLLLFLGQFNSAYTVTCTYKYLTRAGLLPRARVVYPPLLEGEVRPSIAPSNVTADIAPLRHEATEDRDAEECSIAAQDARDGGANLRQRQQPSNGSEAVRTLTQIVSTFKDVKEDDHSDSGSHDEAGLLVGK